METDALIIGGGYYGAQTAIDLRASRPDLKITIAEREPQRFQRAASQNQGQLHAGYMYSKFPDLARECVTGAKEFRQLYGNAINDDTLTYYGVHQSSDISAADYEAFCRQVGLPLSPVTQPRSDFFGPALTQVYETAEKTFDNHKLQDILAARLTTANIQTMPGFAAKSIAPSHNALEVQSEDGQVIRAKAVFNATFADSNQLHEQSSIPKLPLDHAVFLHFLVDLPPEFAHHGLIVVRGMYAALTPASEGAGSSHVLASGQYRVVRTSHLDAPSQAVNQEEIAERYAMAVEEASAYMPALHAARFVGSVIGTRTNYIDPATGVAASRAVVLPDYAGIPGYHCVFGGKVTCLPEITEPIRKIAEHIGR